MTRKHRSSTFKTSVLELNDHFTNLTATLIVAHDWYVATNATFHQLRWKAYLLVPFTTKIDLCTGGVAGPIQWCGPEHTEVCGWGWQAAWLLNASSSSSMVDTAVVDFKALSGVETSHASTMSEDETEGLFTGVASKTSDNKQ